MQCSPCVCTCMPPICASAGSPCIRCSSFQKRPEKLCVLSVSCVEISLQLDSRRDSAFSTMLAGETLEQGRIFDLLLCMRSADPVDSFPMLQASEKDADDVVAAGVSSTRSTHDCARFFDVHEHIVLPVMLQV